jgi:hypothetical protein
VIFIEGKPAPCNEGPGLAVSEIQETQIVIGGENNIDYDVLIRAMDAARGTPEAPLFPQVLLSSGVS